MFEVLLRNLDPHPGAIFLARSMANLQPQRELWTACVTENEVFYSRHVVYAWIVDIALLVCSLSIISIFYQFV